MSVLTDPEELMLSHKLPLNGSSDAFSGCSQEIWRSCFADFFVVYGFYR